MDRTELSIILNIGDEDTNVLLTSWVLPDFPMLWILGESAFDHHVVGDELPSQFIEYYFLSVLLIKTITIDIKLPLTKDSE